jgi:hypothetical protein
MHPWKPKALSVGRGKTIHFIQMRIVKKQKFAILFFFMGGRKTVEKILLSTDCYISKMLAIL